MGKTFNLSVVIGAALSGSFKSTVGGALGQVKALGSAIQHMESGQADIGRFRKLKTNLEGTKAAMAAAQTEAGRLAREFKSADQESARLGKGLAAAKERLAAVAAEMKGAKRPGQELKQAYAAAKAEVKSLGDAQKQAAQQASALGKSFSEAKTKAGALKTQAESQGVALQRLRQQMQQAGVSTRSLAADQAKLGASLERARCAQAKLGAALAKQQANLDKRAQYRGQLFGAAAMGASIAIPIKAAIDFESAMSDVRKTVDFPTPEGLVEFGKTIKAMSREIPISASGLAQIAASGGQLGIAVKDIPQFTKTVAKMATAFDMLPNEAGDAMAKLSNVYKIPITALGNLGDAINQLGNNSAARERDIVNVLARVGGTAKAVGLSAVQTAALSSTMLSLGRAPEVAATGLNALLMKVATADKGNKKFQQGLIAAGISAKKLKFAFLKDPQKALNLFLETLAKIPKAKNMGVLMDLFGLEYADDMALLVEGIKELRKEQGYVAKEADYAGSMQKEFAARAATTANSLQLLKNRLVEAGINFGSVFLPDIAAAAGVLGRISSRVADFAERFPLLTKVIGGTIGGFIGLRVATIAFGYAGTFVKGGILSLMVGLRGLQASLALTRSGMVALNATAGGTALGSVAGKAAGGSALGSIAATALTPVRAIGNAVLHPVAAIRSLGSALAGLGRGAARGAGAGLRTVGSAAAGMGRLLLNPIGGIRSLGGAMIGFARLAVPAVVVGIRAIGLAMMSNPVGIGLAVIAGAALAIYKYWQPIKAFFGGLWGGFESGFSSAFSGIGSALAPLQPVFNAVGAAINWVWSGIKSLVGWFGNLFAPANASSETLKQCASAGQILGHVLGVVVGGAVRLLIAPFQMLGSAVQFVWNLFQNGPYQAVVSGFNQIKAFFGGLWGGLKERISAAFAGMGVDQAAVWSSLGAAFSAVGTAIGWVGNGIKTLVTWFGNLFAPANASSETLGKCASAGQIVGHVLGTLVVWGVRLLVGAFELLGKAVQFVWNLFQSAPVQAVISGFTQIKTWLENFSLADVGRKVIGTLVSGIKSVGSTVKKALTSALGTAEPLFPHSDAKEGPFSRLTASGRALIETFGAGIRAAGSMALINPLGSILGGAQRLIGATALAVPLVLQPTLAMTPLPNMAPWGSTSPAMPAIPEIGAAIREERPQPAIPDPSGIGERFGVDSPPTRGPININMTGDIVIHAAPGADGANIAAQVREQVRLALEEAKRQLEAEQRGALYD